MFSPYVHRWSDWPYDKNKLATILNSPSSFHMVVFNPPHKVLLALFAAMWETKIMAIIIAHISYSMGTRAHICVYYCQPLHVQFLSVFQWMIFSPVVYISVPCNKRNCLTAWLSSSVVVSSIEYIDVSTLFFYSPWRFAYSELLMSWMLFPGA